MNFTQKVIWAEIKLKVLESAMMLNDDYSNDDVTAKLMEVIEILDNTEPKGVHQIAIGTSSAEDQNRARNC